MKITFLAHQNEKVHLIQHKTKHKKFNIEEEFQLWKDQHPTHRLSSPYNEGSLIGAVDGAVNWCGQDMAIVGSKV